MSDQAVKRGPGRPKLSDAEKAARKKTREALKLGGVEREPVRTSTVKMKAKPNWEGIEADAVDTPDRLRIDPAMVPDGMSLLWVTDSVYGQGMPQHRGKFEKSGWTPVHGSDFDGQFDGMFTPRGHDGEINADGLVLMARPKQLTDRAKKLDKQRAYEQVAIKEAALRGGDLPDISLDSKHSTALRTNKINKTIERIEIPE